MSVIPILLFVSLGLGIGFLVAFVWAVRAGQFDDTVTPSMRILTDEKNQVVQPGKMKKED